MSSAAEKTGSDPNFSLGYRDGHAEEWAETASWPTAHCRVVALEARGHGHSERVQADLTHDAVVADAAFVVEELGLRPVVVVGQSLGGLTALSLTARRPELVRALVLVDAAPSAGGEDVHDEVEATARALREWPAWFQSRAAAPRPRAPKLGGVGRHSLDALG